MSVPMSLNVLSQNAHQQCIFLKKHLLKILKLPGFNIQQYYFDLTALTLSDEI